MTDLFRRAALVLLALASLQCGTKAAQQPGEAGIDESFIDRSADPCTDFYQFACGTWIAEHPVDKYSSQEHFRDGEGRTSILLRKILDTDRENAPYIADPDAALLGRFYDSCLTSRASTSVSHAPLDSLLAGISRAASLDDLARVVATLHTNGVASFFWLGVDLDPGDPTRAVATLYASGWSNDGGYGANDPSNTVSPYADHIARIAGLYGVTIDANQVLAVESSLAANALSDEARRDPQAIYHPTPFATFAAAAPSFPWAAYLSSAALPAVTEINILDPGYFAKLDELFAAQPVDALKAYLTWRVLEVYASTLGQQFVTEEARFHFGVEYGDPTPAPDWWACLQSTESVYGFPLSRPYVSVVFDEDKKAAALKILSSVRDAFRGEIQSRDWIDDATRAEAENKLDKIVDKVGYPDVWPEPIAPLAPGASYLEWWLQIEVALRAKNIAKLATGFDRKEWSSAPAVTNAFYSAPFNEIVFPAAILQSPQFVVERASAVNYGAIGAIMGHELTHGFDDHGRQLDGDGKLRDWWTADVGSEYVKRAACVADQYSHYEPLPGQVVDGKLTLGENIADLGGAKLAYAAYKGAVPHESFAGPFDADQQFFLSFAQIRCSNWRDATIATLLRDTHSPDKFRVNGVVTNLPEFASAFKCPAGSPMAPTSRCEVW